MINTLNESSLHKTLKELYSLNSPGSKMEVPAGPFIADIVEADGSVIEIQTGNLSSLLKKCMFCIENKRKIKIVYPLAVEKYIETRNLKSGKCSKRKSPAKKNLYSVFREITGLYPILLNRYFTLEILEVSVIEERTDIGELQQSRNGLRRFRKSWNKDGKRINRIGENYLLHGKKSYRKLLPDKTPESFSAKELYNIFISEGKKISLDQVHLLIWVYSKAGLIEFIKKEGRSNIYRLT
jgi:hypothetical protein